MKVLQKALFVVVMAVAAGCSATTAGRSGTGGVTATGGAGAGGAGGIPIRVLVWNTALGYGHQSRITALPLLQARGATDNIAFDVSHAHTTTVPEGQADTTSDPSVFTDAGLDPYDVVFFLNTTGSTLDQDGQGDVHRQALITFVGKGRGFVGTHSATDTYDTGWPWYTDFIGANFASHSNAGTRGTASYEQTDGGPVMHPILRAAGTPNPWNRTEEWYTFTRDPLASAIPGVTILLTCTDASITTQRPSAWVHDLPVQGDAGQGGRMFYTAFGHSVTAFQEKAVMDLIVAGVQWAANRL